MIQTLTATARPDLSTEIHRAIDNRFEKSISHSAAVLCRRSIKINANNHKVWKVLSDIDNWSSWHTEIKRSRLENKLQPGGKFSWTSGGASIISVLHTVESGRTLGWTGHTFGLYAVHNWSLSVEDGITTVLVEESMEGFLATIFRKMFNRMVGKQMEQWLNALKIVSEVAA